MDGILGALPAEYPQKEPASAHRPKATSAQLRPTFRHPPPATAELRHGAANTRILEACLIGTAVVVM
jgi:hypothetical protein